MLSCNLGYRPGGSLLESRPGSFSESAEELIIVGETALDEESRQYLTKLKQNFSLPIEYQQFELASGSLFK